MMTKVLKVILMIAMVVNSIFGLITFGIGKAIKGCIFLGALVVDYILYEIIERKFNK